MGHHDIEFEYTQPLTIGGPSGDYILDCPIRSCKFAEYSVMSISSNANATIVLSGTSKPNALDYTGATTLNDDAVIAALAINTTTTAPTYSAPDTYFRIINSQKRLFARIDVAVGNAVFLTVRFRIMPISIIPGPAPTAHPDEGHLVNAARAEMTNKRLEQMGIPVEVGDEGGTYGGRQS